MTEHEEFSSFRDPSGKIFVRDGVFYRRIFKEYAEHFEKLQESGLYEQLLKSNLIIPHEYVSGNFSQTGEMVIRPEQLEFVSYPYEWSFSQLKQASLTTLEIQTHAIKKGMTLKDASAYNIQFHQGNPVFIDTLSFEILEQNQPWAAYRQFCQHFLAPLALMAKIDIGLVKLLTTNIDGIELSLASKLLPRSTLINFGLLVHIHLHASFQKSHSNDRNAQKSANFSKQSFLGLIDSLKTTIKKLNVKKQKTEWDDYYSENNNYSADSMREKEKSVEEFIAGETYKISWDLGANDGRFSRILSKYSKLVCSWDYDYGCLEDNFRKNTKDKLNNILPLHLDLANPSPSIGWANKERPSFCNRGPADLCFALGLVHHIAISNNVPLEKIAEFFSMICGTLIIEFIPKNDSQVIKLLSHREDIFQNYNIDFFEESFKKYFSITRKELIKGTVRTLYRLEKR